MLEVKNLSKTFYSGFWNNKKTQAVKDVSFQVREGEILGLIGTSGCGKTTVSRMILGMLEADEGSILYEGRDITKLGKKEWRKLRKEIQMVYQIPQQTFNPRFTVYESCAEPIRLFHLAKNKEEEKEMVEAMLNKVGISSDQMNKYPHEISGGQAQRISIIRSLSLRPKLLVCDESTTMLDVSVQAQIISLLKEIRKESNISMIFISHDLDVVRYVCDRIIVMDQGEILEEGTPDEIFNHPKTAFTRKLIGSSLSLN